MKVQWLRTRNGSGAAAYLDGETDRFVTSFASTKDDGELGEVLPLLDPLTGDASFSQRFGIPPKDKPFIVPVNGRFVAAGDPIWDKGAVKLESGSADVIGIATDWDGDFKGRYFTPATGDTVLRAVAGAIAATVSQGKKGSQACSMPPRASPARSSTKPRCWHRPCTDPAPNLHRHYVELFVMEVAVRPHRDRLSQRVLHFTQHAALFFLERPRDVRVHPEYHPLPFEIRRNLLQLRQDLVADR